MTDEDQVSETNEQAPARKKRLSGRAKAILLVLVVVVIVCITIWFIHYQTRGKYFQSTDDAYIQSDAVTVSSKVSGYIEQVYVGDNQNVKAGTPLARIDPRDYRAQAAQYQAQIERR